MHDNARSNQPSRFAAAAATLALMLHLQAPCWCKVSQELHAIPLQHSSTTHCTGVINKVARFWFLSGAHSKTPSSIYKRRFLNSIDLSYILIDHPPSDFQSNLKKLLPALTISCATDLEPLASLHVMEADRLCRPMSPKERLKIPSVSGWQDG